MGDYAELESTESRRGFGLVGVRADEIIEEAQEIDMDEIKRGDIPAHDHPVPQHVVDQIKRHEMYIDQLQGENARMFGNIESSLVWIKKALVDGNDTTRKLSSDLEILSRRVDAYNHVKERTDTIENTIDGLGVAFVPREEWQSAVSALRDQIDATAKVMDDKIDAASRFATKVIAIITTGVGAVLTFLVARMFGG